MLKIINKFTIGFLMVMATLIGSEVILSFIRVFLGYNLNINNIVVTIFIVGILVVMSCYTLNNSSNEKTLKMESKIIKIGGALITLGVIVMILGLVISYFNL